MKERYNARIEAMKLLEEIYRAIPAELAPTEKHWLALRELRSRVREFLWNQTPERRQVLANQRALARRAERLREQYRLLRREGMTHAQIALSRPDLAGLAQALHWTREKAA